MKKRYQIALLLVAVLLIVSGVSYAYFTATVSNAGTTTNVTAGTMSIEFTDGDQVSLDKAVPGDSVTKTFKVKNTGTLAATYNISLTDLTNTFVDQTDLVYTLTSTNGANVSETKMPNAAGYLVVNQSITPNETQEYSLKITFKETNDNQDDNQHKQFGATIKITTETVATVYKDATGAATPELAQGFIPVKYDATGNVVVADTTQEWYDYANHDWANAVLVNCADTTIKDKYFNSDMTLKSSTVGTTISMSDILQMYVWIPRYKYLLWNAENGSSDPQAITIVFESKDTAKSTGSTNGTYLTHPAFTFGDTELNGIWVGKFETSGTTTNLTIKPNVTSLRNTTVGDMFNATRNEELTYSSNFGIDNTKVDTHMMKNMEWGAVAYLSSSIYGRYSDASTCISSGCETWINNNSGMITGCSGASVSASYDSTNTTACASGYDWTTLGVNASTTGNLYGIYDMSGGAFEYVMGNMVDSSGNYYPSSSGLTTVDSKYYDSYAYSAVNDTDHARGKLGDATKETLKTFGSGDGGWYGDSPYLPNYKYSWFVRSSNYSVHTSTGVFAFFRGNGGADSTGSFRSAVALAQ